MKSISEFTIKELREKGYCVVAFTPEELRGVNPYLLADSLIAYAWDEIDMIAKLDLIEDLARLFFRRS